MDKHNFLTESSRPFSLEDDRLPMPLSVFGLDTVVLQNLPVRRVTLGNRRNPIRLTLAFDDFDYLGLWTKPMMPSAPYVCIEPWSTLPECTFTDSALEHKPSIRALAPGQAEILTYQTIVEGI
ncbi:MAG: hypothetical protein LUF81_03255 [Clostridiales bacterium]|nr:hypothetical protein [Clostridiales bacterium]